MPRTLTPEQAKAFYDRLGKGLESQRFYEDPATDELIAHADFEDARNVFEFGCGTGRLAERLFRERLPPGAVYRGVDVSETMCALTRARLAPFGDRARVDLSSGSMDLDLEDGSADRFLSTYVLDLLPEEAIRRLIAEARRVLVPGGLLCAATLTTGQGPVSRSISAVLRTLHALHPVLTGGCRAIRLTDYLDAGWQVRHRTVVVSYGIASEVVIAAGR